VGEIIPRNVFLVILWSFGLYILMYSFQYLGVLIASRRSGQNFESIISGSFASPQTDFIVSLTALLVGVPLVFLATKFLWGRSFEWMRLQFDVKSLFLGLVLGLLLPFVVLLILKLLGVAKLSLSANPLHSPAGLIIAGYAFTAIFAGLAEEVVFRGMAVREIAIENGWLLAALIGGVYFGLVHLASRLKNLTPGNGLWILLGSLLVTFLFAALYVRSGSLWLPIGFHIAWNFCLKGIMGVTLSGQEANAGLLTVELSGSQWLTGGNFGVEISAVSMLFYILVAFLVVKIPWNGVVELLSNR
jgi:membrane protease YdiL (CAAX protease family)